MPLILSGDGITNDNINSLAASKLTGTLPDANAPSGSVIQVVNATVSGDTGTTSNSFSSTGLFATITPSSTSSKILCLASSNISFISNTGNQLNTSFYRGTSGNGSGSLIGADGYYWVVYTNTAYQPSQMMYLDSPASTSALTYTVMHRTSNSGQIVGWCYGLGASNRASLILMEIAA